MVALSMADGYARLTSKPQCVIVHVDVGTQGLGAAVHNASCGRAPVLIFAGLSPFTLDGEHRGSRTEYIHWIQDVPDQKQIVAQYCRYAGEIKTGANVKQVSTSKMEIQIGSDTKQMVQRALQFATSAPCGPVYLVGAREVMEQEINPYTLRTQRWKGVGAGALPDDAVHAIASDLVNATEPLVIVGYTGRNHAAVGALTQLADLVPGVRVLDTGGSDLCFPADHRGTLGLRYGVDPFISSADFILVMDCDVPWIPTHNRPRDDARVYHVDGDPLKQQMPMFYIEAEGRWKADAYTALRQLTQHIRADPQLGATVASYTDRWDALGKWQAERQAGIQKAALPPADGSLSTAYLCAQIRRLVPADTIFAIEAVTNAPTVAEQLGCTLPGSSINCGGGGLGWSGGGALGIKLATDQAAAEAAGAADQAGKEKLVGKFVCQIVGDGTYLFSVPGSVYWIAARYEIPILTIVLNNKGAPYSPLLLRSPPHPPLANQSFKAGTPPAARSFSCTRKGKPRPRARRTCTSRLRRHRTMRASRPLRLADRSGRGARPIRRPWRRNCARQWSLSKEGKRRCWRRSWMGWRGNFRAELEGRERLVGWRMEDGIRCWIEVMEYRVMQIESSHCSWEMGRARLWHYMRH